MNKIRFENSKEWRGLWDAKIKYHIEDLKRCYKKDNNIPENDTLTDEQLKDMWAVWGDMPGLNRFNKQ